MSWSVKIRALQSLATDIPDERIELIAELCEIQVQKSLGADAFSSFAEDKRLEYAICALAISKLILSSRSINESSSIHKTSGWGEGNIYPSEVNEMINLAKRWEADANQVIATLRADIPAEFGWIDL